MKKLLPIIGIAVALSFALHTATATRQTKAAKPVDAQKVYRKNCATCHGNDGRAKTIKGRLKGAKNLTDATWQASVTDERITDVITIGQEGGMPAFGKKLSQDEVTALVGYVRALKK
jgi:cbb3-type cytochrome c oxidase subunit III